MRAAIALLCAVLISAGLSQNGAPENSRTCGTPTTRPIILIHGILANSSVWQHMYPQLEVLNRPIFAMKIGENEYWDSLLKPISEQMKYVFEWFELFQKSYGYTEVDILTHSQGSILSRYYIQYRDPEKHPAVKHYVTMAGVHGGQFGIPKLPVSKITDWVAKIIGTIPYSSVGQEISFGGYWRDPYALDSYKKKCEILPMMNGEIESDLKNQIRERILDLDFMFLISSSLDEVIRPYQAGLFYTHLPNSDELVSPTSDQSPWGPNNDVLGINEMIKLKKFKAVIVHDMHHADWLLHYSNGHYAKYIIPALRGDFDPC